MITNQKQFFLTTLVYLKVKYSLVTSLYQEKTLFLTFLGKLIVERKMMRMKL